MARRFPAGLQLLQDRAQRPHCHLGQRAARRGHQEVNSADPGYVATDLNHHTGSSTVEQGAEIIVTLVTLAEDGPTGTFQAAASTRPW